MNTPHASNLIDRLRKKEAVIGVVGLGYVGLPLLIRYVDVGYKVIGFDTDERKHKQLAAGEQYLPHIDTNSLDTALSSRQAETTSDFSHVAKVDAIILCVPTPLDENKQPNLSFVTNSVEQCLPHMRAGQVMSLESTTYPGTTEEELRPKLEQAGMQIGEDVFLVYSPEREDPGNADFTTHNIPKIISGSTSECALVARHLYEQIIDELIPVSSTRVAEMTKILENTYRAVNIALVNELKLVADKMNIDIFEVVRAAATKPFGFKPFYPGPGLGGHCIPIDPFYLSWKAKAMGVATKFIELAGEVNTAMPNYVTTKIIEALNNQSKSVRGADILLLGLAYKKNVGDTRESAAAELIASLSDWGANVDFSDPHVPEFPAMRRYNFNLQSKEISAETLRRYDCVVVITDHDAFEWSTIEKHSRLLVDTRGVFETVASKVIRA